jgi:hypothetical protein
MAAAMYPHLMAPSMSRAPGPFDPYSAAVSGLDPFRDPYGLLARDPLREAREQQLLRLNPLGSLVNSELERAKALGLAGYSSLPTPGLPPGYPTTTTLSMMSKVPPSPYSSLYTSPSLPGLGLPPGLGHGAIGMNGVPGPGGQYKDPLRR